MKAFISTVMAAVIMLSPELYMIPAKASSIEVPTAETTDILVKEENEIIISDSVIATTLLSDIDVSEEVIEPEYDISGLTDEEIRLIALITLGEAESECEEGKRLVIDTILNRYVDSYHPNTIKGVICQKNQYISLNSSRIKRMVVSDDTLNLVRDECKHRTNKDVLYFRTKHYHTFGTPVMKIGNHYFSKK